LQKIIFLAEYKKARAANLIFKTTLASPGLRGKIYWEIYSGIKTYPQRT